MWMRDQAIDLCRAIEEVAPDFGCHVALTGGLLYKFGPRKDCDLIFYAIRVHGDATNIDKVGLFGALATLGIRRRNPDLEYERFVVKAHHDHGDIDLLFPDVPEGEYGEERVEPQKPAAAPIDF